MNLGLPLFLQKSAAPPLQKKGRAVQGFAIATVRTFEAMQNPIFTQKAKLFHSIKKNKHIAKASKIRTAPCSRTLPIPKPQHPERLVKVVGCGK